MESLYDDNLLVSVFQVLNNIIRLWSTASVICSSFLPAAGAPASFQHVLISHSNSNFRFNLSSPVTSWIPQKTFVQISLTSLVRLRV